MQCPTYVVLLLYTTNDLKGEIMLYLMYAWLCSKHFISSKMNNIARKWCWDTKYLDCHLLFSLTLMRFIKFHHCASEFYLHAIVYFHKGSNRWYSK